jgi:hypothetical protein
MSRGASVPTLLLRGGDPFFGQCRVIPSLTNFEAGELIHVQRLGSDGALGGGSASSGLCYLLSSGAAGT